MLNCLDLEFDIISANKKATLYRKYIKSPTLAIKEAHRKYKNLFTNCNQKAADMYYAEIIDAWKQNVHTLWAIFGPIINSTKACKSSKIQQLTHQAISYTNDKDIANILNNYFSNIGKTLTKNLTSDTNYSSYLKNRTINSLYLQPVLKWSEWLKTSKEKITRTWLYYSKNRENMCNPSIRATYPYHQYVICHWSFPIPTKDCKNHPNLFVKKLCDPIR